MTNITSKEMALLKAIDDSEYGDSIMDPIWTWSATDCIEGEGITEASMGGIIASAGKKGLINIHLDKDEPENNCIAMTEAGWKAYTDSIGRENMNKWKEQKDIDAWDKTGKMAIA